MPLLDVLLDRVVAFVPVLLSLTVHEWAHAWTAWKLGDDTARLLGRVSLDPLAHVDPVGTVLLPLLGIPFGWARPVPIEPTRFDPRVNMATGVLLVAAAGPVSNLVLAAAGCAGLALLAPGPGSAPAAGPDPSFAGIAAGFLQTVVVVNVALAVFNLLPIPPLDGSRIVEAFVPERMRPLWNDFGRIAPFVLVALLVLPFFGGSHVVGRAVDWARQLVVWVQGP